MTNDEPQEVATEEKGDSQETTEETTEKVEATAENKDTEDYRAKLNAQNRFLEKEGYEFKDGKWVKPPKSTISSSKEKQGLSDKDVLYLARATDIDPEDVDEVVTYAHKMGVSVSEAHKFYKPILSERAEERKTAQATQTRGNRGTAHVSNDELLKRAEKGEELKDSDLQAIAEARQARKVAARTGGK